ncbi:uncharacterized protein OCT59_018978 [Rhizophagus irregularis]|nr:hypothetical protein OCT59_018978 [Rhizophagus irregularis]
MSILNNKTQVPIKSKLSDSNIGLDHKNCSYCNQPFIEKLWCKKCDPYKIIEGWTSENPDIDKFIKDTMYSRKYGTWLEWVPFDRFTNIEQIGEGGFSKVYSATWIDGKADYKYEYGNWKKLDPKPIKVALKKLNDSHEMSVDYLNELKIHWDVYLEENFTLGFYGMTKDPVTKEFMMIIEFMNEGSLRSILLNEFNEISWSSKIRILGHLILGLNNLHKLGYFHKNLHSGNILIFNSKPEFGKGTPEIYKKLAYRCMNSNPNQRPKADELNKILIFWYHSINGEIFSYKGGEVKAIFEEADSEVETIFEEADREIPNIPTSYGKNSNIVVHTSSQIFSFRNLPNPSNSSIINSYFEENMDNKDISDKYEICSYCEKPITEELWCNECDPLYMIDGWTSDFPDIDKFIKDTMYNARDYNYYFLEWVPFDRFAGIKQICEDELAKMYSATWIDVKSKYEKLDDGNWKKYKSESMEIVLKSLNESQDISPKYLNKLKFYWNLSKMDITLKFYGMTKNPETKEIMMIIESENVRTLRNILINDFWSILWKSKIHLLWKLAFYLKYLHELKYFHENLHSGNILQNNHYTWLLNFELFKSTNNNGKICGILPFVAPEVFSGESYTFSSDVYSFGIIMAELSSGKTPFYNRSHNSNLALDICDGLRPEFGKGTPEIYKKLAYKCMNANSIERPTADELYQVVNLWNDILNGKVLGYVGKEIKVMFEDADKEIPNISTLYEKNPDAELTCQEFTFSDFPKPVNSSIITSYIDEIYNEEDNQIDNKICFYCNNPFTEKLWCKECDPYCMIEGWTSGNLNIDKFIKDSIYNARQKLNPEFLEWVPFDRLINIEQIGKGGFAKVYSATWIDGKSKYKNLSDGSWKKLEPESTKVALKKLNGSQNISAEYLNELKIYWDICLNYESYLTFYGMTKDPETKEFMIIMDFADGGNLRNIVLHNFKNISWKDKINWLFDLAVDLKNMHKLGYFHKDLHSGNILRKDSELYISDFGLSEPANEQKLDNKIYGVLPYIAPEVLNKEPYTSSSDIYSFGIIMIELSFGKPPFYNKKHNLNLALAICDGLRPEFGKGTPEIYKKLAYRCTNANSIERPTANELFNIIKFWFFSIISFGWMQEEENFGYKGKEIKKIFEEADKERPNISIFYEKDPDAIYTSRELTFSNLSKPVNSSIISLYLQEEKVDEVNTQDSQLVNLDVKRFL